MKKYFIYAIMALASLSFVACDKDKDNAEDPATDKTNSYLQVDDLMPLFLVPISQAEEMVNEMGFKGGWQQNDRESFYLYVSDNKQDSISLYVDSDERIGKGLVVTISYQASKGIIPSDAKGWLSHIPEKVKLPERISKVTDRYELPFFYALNAIPSIEDEEAYYTYPEYIAGLQNLSSGMQILAMWGSGPVFNSAPTGYYGGIEMWYNYMNGTDHATLMLYGFYHEQDNNEPIMPGDE